MSVSANEFQGQVAIVTGAAGQGIGKATARRLALGGAHVVVTDVHERRIESVCSELRDEAPEGVQVIGKLLDVSVFADSDRVTREVLAELGPIRILVNNAAYNIMAPIWDYRIEDWTRVMNTNINGPWYLTKLSMIQMRDAGQGGAVVNISSVAPDCGGMGLEGPYAVSKGGLNTLTRSCAYEGGPYGIRSNSIAMGIVRGTRFADVQHQDLTLDAIATSPLRALPAADDIAEAVAYLASERGQYITGETINVSGGSIMRY